jgi:uncharacterized membrane protein YdfJ with MMPL/SSD domain
VVTGHRIPNKEETQNGEQETIKTHLFRKPWLILAAVLAVLLAAGGIVWGVFGKRRKNKN